MKITTQNFNIECTIDELQAMEQYGILAMIRQSEPTTAIPFPLPELPTAGGTNEPAAVGQGPGVSSDAEICNSRSLFGLSWDQQMRFPSQGSNIGQTAVLHAQQRLRSKKL